MKRLAVFVGLLSAVCCAEAASAQTAAVSTRAIARAEGNERAQAIALGESLLATQWPAQVLKIRVDAVPGHRVAGITLSGTKFHQRLDARGFLSEVRSLIGKSFAGAPLEEVDVWTTVPIDVARGTVVSGTLAQPTSRIVFSVTVVRADLPRLNAIFASNDVYWDAAWRSALG